MLRLLYFYYPASKIESWRQSTKDNCGQALDEEDLTAQLLMSASIGCVQFESAAIIMGGSIVNVALPALQRDLTLSHEAQQWVIDAYPLNFRSCMLVAARAAVSSSSICWWAVATAIEAPEAGTDVAQGAVDLVLVNVAAGTAKAYAQLCSSGLVITGCSLTPHDISVACF